MEQNTIRWKIIGRRVGKVAWVILRFLLLFGLGYTLISPFFSIFLGAFRSEKDIWDPTVVWITRNYTTEHLKSVIKIMDYWTTLGRTTFIAAGSGLLQMFTCAFAGYGFARYNFKGKPLLFGLVILTIMVPPQVLMMPMYSTYRNLGLLDSVASFWVTSAFGMGLRSGLFIFIYRQVFRALPSDLEDAASIDGCGHIGTYFRIMLPNAVTSMATVFLFSFIWHSTDYFTTSIMMPTKYTLMVSLSGLSSKLAGITGGTARTTVSPLILQALLQAGSLLVVLPLIIVFVLCQRYFRAGIERTGLVG